MNLQLSSDHFSPLVLSAYVFQGMQAGSSGKPYLPVRTVYDYEIEFITESSGSQIIDDQNYPISPGDIVWRAPGSVTRGELPYSCIAVIFDLEGKLRPERNPYNLMQPKVGQPRFQTELLDRIPPVFQSADSTSYRYLFEEVVKNFVNPNAHSPLLLKSLVLQILYQLSLDAQDPLSKRDLAQTNHSARVKRLIQYIRQNYRSKLNLEDLAVKANLSPTYLHRVFTQAAGISPLEYVTRVRIETSRELLATTTKSAAQIAQECGIPNVPYFFTLFKKHTGMSPQEFRRQYRHPYQIVE